MNVIFDPALVLYLSLHELDGVTLITGDAYGHLCTVTGTLWSPNGRWFDGVNDYISCYDGNELDFTSDDFTVMLWFRPETVAKRVYLLQRGNYNIGGYFFTFNDDNSLRLDTYQSGVGQTSKSATSVLSVNQWAHCAVIRQGASARYYINAAEKPGTAPAHNDPLSYDGPVLISTSMATRCIAGTVGEIAVYRRALASQEIQHEYLGTKWRYR